MSENLRCSQNKVKKQALEQKENSTEILRIIDNICKKHDLDYILCYGTLLGAVRHKGFIPWDEDLDIIMMRKDYNKLIEVLPDEINRIDYLKNNFGLTLTAYKKSNLKKSKPKSMKYFNDFLI